MSARHAFSTVRHWRAKGPIGVAIAAVVLAGGLAAPTPAQAAPDAPAPAEQPEPTRGPGGLEAPDIASAKTIAALEGERVEVIGERTLNSSTWALPDGSMSTGEAAAPIWVPQDTGDGTSSADWAPVNLTLEVADDGNVAPKAHPSDLVLAGAGAPEDSTLLSMDGPSGESVGIEWTTPLPAPRLEGPRATYVDVQPGVDLVVEATATGYEQFYVLTRKPADGQTPDLSLTVTGEGVTATEVADGGVEFTDAAGEVVGSSATPLAWDAEVDAERQHPITEPWTDAGEPKFGLVPQPDWGIEKVPAGEPSITDPKAGPSLPTVGQVLPYPPGAGEQPSEDAGQAEDPEAVKAQASDALPLPNAAEVVAPDTVELTLTPGPEFLTDPDTQYPVVIDPDYTWASYFDTWVAHGYANTDLSASTELRIGTYNGGGDVARSFLNWDLDGIGGKVILESQLSLWNFHSWSCTPRAWDVYAANLADTGTRLANQPATYDRWAISDQTRTASCGEGWVSANVTSLIQAWANGGFRFVGMNLRAQNESDNFAWKKFNSANAAGGVPSLYIRWNAPPAPATGLFVTNALSATDGAYINTRAPRLTATAHDADGKTDMLFRLHNEAGTPLWEKWAYGIPDGSVGFVDVPENITAEAGRYKYEVHSYDGLQWNTASSGFSGVFVVDTTKPAAPFVSSTDYPDNGTWNKGANQAGTFLARLAADDPTASYYRWGLSHPPNVIFPYAGTANSNLFVTPPGDGIYVLQVQTVDKAGNESAITRYAFNVGRAGLVSPVEGSEVVRRVRLQVTGESVFTHIKYLWRRGPDSTDPQPIPLPTLTRANGSALTSTWTPMSGLGDYATWDASTTLGNVPGPVQVQAIVATDGNGAGQYATPWVTVTVSPDAQGAATDSVGPGTVNLLTGDYSLSATDVDEFGLALGRAASSREPRAGLEPQLELLSAEQQKISNPAGTPGYRTVYANLARETSRGHSGSTANAALTSLDSLKVTPSGASADSFAEFAAYANPGLLMERTYRVTGWIYVPAATGLSPQDSRGLALVGFVRDKPTQVYAPPIVSNKPTLTDVWQQLTVDVVVPAGSDDVIVRLYNGFTATNKPVFFDDLSVREIWSPLGPQWNLGTADEGSGTAYSHISQPYPDVAALHLSGGGEIWFTGAGDKWWPEPGAEALTLINTNAAAGTWELKELDGTISRFIRQPNSSPTDSQLDTTSPPVGVGKTRLIYARDGSGRMQVDRLVGAVEPGVDGAPALDDGTGNLAACANPDPNAAIPVGCEVMKLHYAAGTTATATAFGSFKGQLDRVDLISTDTGAAATSAVTAVQYAYDDQGRLREVWDPRISPALKTRYDYDADGRVTTVTNPAELPWRFTYGTGGANSTLGSGDLVDRSSGRLLKVSRASLVPGSLTQTGPDTTSTVVYNVPLTRGAGGPYDLNAAAFSTWAQVNGPTDATAVFGPETIPTVTTANATTPGADGYKAATVHYLDASAREVNTATPTGAGAPAAGYIDTAEYDRFGNVVRSLDAGNRLLALGQVPTATADLAALNLTASTTQSRAQALSTYNTYATDGIDLLRTRGPLLRLAVGNDPTNIQLVHDLSTTVYDEGKPEGTAYHLPTTETAALLVANTPSEQLLDVVVTKNGYNPIDSAGDPVKNRGPSSGWKVGSPTSVTVDAVAGGANLTSLVRYNDQGKTVESRKVGANATGTDARTVRSVYYTAGPNTEKVECGNKPAYAGLPCMTYVVGTVTGHDTTRMAGVLPVKTITACNRYGSAMAVTETATGPVGGTTITQTRTTTTTYDNADRVTSVALAGTGAGVGAAVSKTVSTYDPASGDVTTVAAVNPATGAVTSQVVKVFDALGRMTRYTDAGGAWTASVFDAFGKPTTVTDSLGTTTSFTYDRTKEPRGFVTSVSDSVAGTISATYGPDGEILEQALPGGVKLAVGYDANRSPISRTYTRTSDNAVISASSVVENGNGQWVTHTTAASTKNYAYDRLQRLTDVRDSTTGINTCTSRRYAYNERAGRTAMSSAVSGGGSCVNLSSPGTAPVTTTGYTYDSADRLVTDTATGAAGWTYDPLGRITNAPVASNPGKRVANAFYVNDLIASQTIDGVARQTWTLDTLQRFNSYTQETWLGGAWQQAVTKVNHYDSDSDSPAWIAEDASLPNEVTRYIDGLDGNLALQTGKTGAKVLQLIDLHGDVMTTVPIRDGQSTADWTGLRHQTADEFGNPTNLTTGGKTASTGAAPGKDNRYGWLGGKQRSTDALAGVLLMGVRLYDPATGRFWSVDPEPGGNATAYDYCTADPVNCFDLDGRWGWGWAKKALKKVAVIAEVASIIPGPIGAAAAGISSVAYAATGQRGKAVEMGLIAAANMVGAGSVVRVGARALRAAGSVGQKAGRSVVKATNGCNSFTPKTGVLMADGTSIAIEDVQVGDLVASRDPMTGELSAQPVLTVIAGAGDKHLISVTSAPATDDELSQGQGASGILVADIWTATANHPVWVIGHGWTDAEKLSIGDLTLGASGQVRVIRDLTDHGWVPGTLVYNLAIANVHTFAIGGSGDGTLVHNASCGVNANSLNYRGNTHVYKIVDRKGVGAASVVKYGKGSRMTAGGSSVRARTQVNKMNRTEPGRYNYTIMSHHKGTAAARRMESRYIGAYERHFGAKPRGNIRR